MKFLLFSACCLCLLCGCSIPVTVSPAVVRTRTETVNVTTTGFEYLPKGKYEVFVQTCRDDPTKFHTGTLVVDRDVEITCRPLDKIQDGARP